MSPFKKAYKVNALWINSAGAQAPSQHLWLLCQSCINVWLPQMPLGLSVVCVGADRDELVTVKSEESADEARGASGSMRRTQISWFCLTCACFSRCTRSLVGCSWHKWIQDQAKKLWVVFQGCRLWRWRIGFCLPITDNIFPIANGSWQRRAAPHTNNLVWCSFVKQEEWRAFPRPYHKSSRLFFIESIFCLQCWLSSSTAKSRESFVQWKRETPQWDVGSKASKEQGCVCVCVCVQPKISQCCSMITRCIIKTCPA